MLVKNNGNGHFCDDYHAVTMKDAYLLPRVDDTLDALEGTQWVLSTLDSTRCRCQKKTIAKQHSHLAKDCGSSKSCRLACVMPLPPYKSSWSE